ncbi:helix-turn-helix domain-containing protein [Escherichia coli]|uniref:helix-turn-helix domain-containing protein n=1 Tax=Escherichia coli TaxID=562 RepID=UPI001CA77315|nr:helix-turn-helix domain-containing protein [Escherichia coli]QZY67677.1 hypothetical protein K7X33_16415 [Escherichia coli]
MLRKETKVKPNDFDNIILHAIQNNFELTPEKLRKQFFDGVITRQAVFEQLQRFKRQHPELQSAFMSKREKAVALFDDGKTISEVMQILNICSKSAYSFKGGY